jgi:hypothetical protein
MPGTDDFSTSIPLEVLPQLLALSQQFGFDPLSSTEMESYFVALLNSRSLHDIETKVIPSAFVSVGKKPCWLQGAEWPVSNGEPMVFLGQFDVPRDNGFVPGETSVYVFCDRTTRAIQSVIQRVGYIP